MRQSNNRERRGEFHACWLPTIKEDPGAPKGARVCRRMGEGLGAGGHSTRRYPTNAAAPRTVSCRAELFSGCGAATRAPTTRPRPSSHVGRQLDMPAVGKFQISQMDAKTPLAPAAALDDIARADREPARETIYQRTHANLCQPLPNLRGTSPAVMPDQRDGSETVRQRARIPVNRCGQRPRLPSVPIPTFVTSCSTLNTNFGIERTLANLWF